MFESLFKFNRIQLAEGSLGVEAGPGAWLVVVLVVGLLALFGLVYYLTDRFHSERGKALSFGLRAVALALLCLPLLQPVLVMPDVVPDENFVAVVVDGSKSMTIEDGTFGPTRADDLRHLLAETDLTARLDEHFQLRYYTFAEEAARTDRPGDDPPEGDATDLAEALQRVLDDFRGLPLTGVVLLTDGADNSDAVPLNQAEDLAARGVPLHVVGVGEEAFEAEREILDVTVSEGIEQTTGAEIDVKVRSWQQEAGPVAVHLYRGDELVFTEQKRLKGGGLIDQFTLFYEPDRPGAEAYSVRLEEAERERNRRNNGLGALIDPRQDTIRVLYVEGHLRPDFKYVRRALVDDTVIDFVSIARTGTGKFYRQGIRTPDELAGGFPRDEAELFAFDAVIFGDVEAAQFNPGQLAMIEKFVRVRGGGFLMLGGRTTFAEGDYWDTPVADLLPVALDPSRRSVLPPDFRDDDKPEDEQGFRFVPTLTGLESPILKLASDPETNRTRWNEVPGLMSINYLGAVKPGALVLAEKPDDDFGDREPLLVVQRYGKGRTAALATASTWRWQMQLPAEDPRHERFWRQLLRWLAADAPEPVNVDLGGQRFAPGDDVPVRVTLYDEAFAPLQDATVEALVTDPFGGVREVAFQAELTEPGVYTARLDPADEGVYQLAVTATADGAPVGSETRSLLVRASNREFSDATLKRTLLTNLAETAGGRYHGVGEADRVPDELRSRRTSTSIYRAEPLWDLPFLFGLILVVLSAEWIWRRRKGLP